MKRWFPSVLLRSAQPGLREGSPCSDLTAARSHAVEPPLAPGVSAWLFRFTLLLSFFSLSPATLAAPIFMGLGDLPGGTFSSIALGVSDDGLTVVGQSQGGAGTEAFRWTASGGMQGLGLLPGAIVSSASGVSADGQIVVGRSLSCCTGGPFRWTASAGMEPLGNLVPGGFAEAVSASGQVIVGSSYSPSGLQAFRWTASGGIQGLGNLINGGLAYHGSDVAADGNTVVGSGFGTLGIEAFRWTPSGGSQGLGDLPGGVFYSEGQAISADGNTVVGRTIVGSGLNGPLFEAYRWTEAGGMTSLGTLGGGANSSSWAQSVSSDGLTIVGGTQLGGAFIWDAVHGMQSLQGVLQTDYGLDLGGWSLQQALAISPDGKTIVGGGLNPAGQGEAWLVRLDPTIKTVLLGPGVLPALPPMPAYAPPISSLPAPDSLISSLPSFASQSAPTLPTEVQNFFDKTVVAIGSWEYPPWLKSSADVASDTLTVASNVYGLSQIAMLSATGHFSEAQMAVDQWALTQVVDDKLVSAIPDLLDAAAKMAKTVATGGDPFVGGLVALNAAIWGDFVAPLLKQFSKDPIDPDYTQMFIPSTQVTINQTLTGNSALDSTLAALLQSSVRTALYLDAANKSFDRYTSAYNAGDSMSALMQIEAVVYYLELYKEAAAETAHLVQQTKELIGTLGPVPAMDPDWLLFLQEQLATDGFSPEIISLFDALGLSTSEIGSIEDLIMGLTVEDFSGLSADQMFDQVESAFLLTASDSSSVPEPATLALLLLGMVLLAYGRRPGNARNQRGQGHIKFPI